MTNARVKFNGFETELSDDITTCGRAPDNVVAFTDDANVSRYHAEIEERADGYWIIDLNSSNGTTVNGESLHGERPLNDGDRILLGGSSEIEFYLGPKPSGTEDPTSGDGKGIADISFGSPSAVPNIDAPANADAISGGIETEAAQVSASSKNLLVIAAIVCGVALLCVGGASLALYFGRGSKCDAKAVITKPEAGDTIANPTEVEVDAENTGCVARAVFTLDGLEIASADSEPYATTLDPKDYPDLADGLGHDLQIVLIDKDGQQIGQPAPVQLAFETRAIEKPSPSPGGTGTTTTGNQQSQTGSSSLAVTLLDVQQMTTGVIRQFRGNLTYNIANRQFLQEIQKRTAEYAQEGFFDRAAQYRDAINVAYVREQNLDAPLGFMLAMSRSRFIPTKQGDNEGLWQMSNAFVTANAYNGLCGTETLSDASQNCAAKASALYMKAIVYGVFDGDVVYSAVAFGKSPAEASAWKTTLPQNRSDLWNVIKTPQEREQLVRFFAAAIVAENPQRFGLKKDHPLSELYRVTQ
jgi:hypothetical protein